ncbi:type VII secretion protein EccE [Saccharothrix hoggarensis]
MAGAALDGAALGGPASGGSGSGGLAIRFVCAQLTVPAALVGVGEPWPVAAALWTSSAVVLVLSVGRWRRRWLSEWCGRYLAFRVRRRRRGALLDVVAPGAWVDGDRVHGPGGVVSVLRPRIASPKALAGLTGPDLRIVVHAGRGQIRRPRAWVAVHARRTPELWHDDELVRVLGNSTRRALRELRRRAVAADPLAADELVATITALAHVTGDREVREGWRFWHSGPVAQACFRLPGATARTALDWLITAAPGVAVTVALGDGADAVLRVAGATEAAVDAAVGVITAHVPLERLDGLHSRGVAASLLIGGVL